MLVDPTMHECASVGNSGSCVTVLTTKSSETADSEPEFHGCVTERFGRLTSGGGGASAGGADDDDDSRRSGRGGSSGSSAQQHQQLSVVGLLSAVSVGVKVGGAMDGIFRNSIRERAMREAETLWA